MTQRQIQQVAILYLARPTPVRWFVIISLSVLTLVLLLSTSHETGHRTFGDLLTLLFPAMLLGSWPLIWMEDHLKWQFANPRAALIPGFALPHLLAWLALACTFNLLLPWGIAAIVNVSGIFMIALCLAVGAANSIAPSAVGFLVLPLILLGNTKLNPRSIDAWLQAEGYRGLALVTIAIACAGAVWRRTTRITRVDEEDLLYDVPVWSMTDEHSATPFRKAKAAAEDAHRNSGYGTGNNTRLDKAISKSRRWSAWRRLRLGIEGKPGYWRGALGRVAIIGVFLAISQWQRSERWSFDGETWSAALQILPLATLFAGLIPAVRLANRLPQMRIERLLPMSNQVYADAILANAAELSIKTWVGVHAVAAVLTYAIPWEGADIPTAGRAATYLLLSAAGLFVTFGAAARYSVASGVFGAFVAALVGFGSTLCLEWYWYGLRPHDGNGAAPFWAIICAIAGGFLIWHARTAWREKELG